MRKILVVVERSKDAIDESAFELLAAARDLGEGAVAAVAMGSGMGDLAGQLARWFESVHVLDDPALAQPDGDFQSRVLASLIDREKPFATLIPHTNTGLELAPMLSVRTGAPLIADAMAIEMCAAGECDAGVECVRAVRAVYGGKVQARVSAVPAENGVLISVRPGAFAAPTAAPEVGGAVHTERVPEEEKPRRQFVETVAPDPGAVDISQAEVLVAVGRGIEDEENLEDVKSLAEAMGAEVACTRPVVDKKWLEKTRQVGTSGVTVKPRVYLALGISGSFQHLGGVKGDPFIAAINTDPAAPIFGVADVGIVGDILDLLPLLEEKIRVRRG
jgi:electron transfer flavoprotein alpha subunit